MIADADIFLSPIMARSTTIFKKAYEKHTSTSGRNTLKGLNRIAIRNINTVNKAVI